MRSCFCTIALPARLSLTVALCMATGFLGAGTPASSSGIPAPRTRPRPDIREGSFRLPVARAIPVAYGASGHVLSAGLAQPTALASGDFDEDGVADLISGYTSPGGNVLTLHRGNVDSIFPHSPEARQRRQLGTFSDEPFSPSARVFQAPVRPDFLATGDFDNDGHWDVVLAASGEASLYLLPGDGNGGLQQAEHLKLAGTVTTLVAGEINRVDGLVDLVVGVRGPDGPALLVFEGPSGALRSAAEVLPIPAAATRLLLGRFVDGPWHDLAVATGEDLLIVRGRDRRLILEEAERAEVAPPVTERVVMPSSIEALAWGDFAWEPIATRELALLLEDGTIRLLKVHTENEGLDLSWKTIGEREVLVPRTRAAAPSSVRRLLSVRISGSPTEDLAILDAIGGRLEVLAGMVRDDDANDLANSGVVVSVDMQEPPIAALGMRLNRDALTDLVLLRQGLGGPLVLETAPLATIIVNTAADSTATDGTCTLREALNNSNNDSDTTGGDCASGAGVDTIGFNIDDGGSTATIAPTSALPTIMDPVTIDGTTQGCASPPCIVLNGSGAGFVPAGLSLAAGSSSVRGLVVQQFNGYGIVLTSAGNIVEGNYSGTDVTGTVDLGNAGSSIRIEDASNNTLGGTTPAARNLFSGADKSGVALTEVEGITSGNQVLGNYIGTDVTGTISLGNTFHGVTTNSANNTIGGTRIGAPNIISGNGSAGVRLSKGAHTTPVLGNHIGTDVTGTHDLGNGSSGVTIPDGANNNIGGTSVGARNIISGNDADGVYVFGATSQGNQILGNFIGTDITGTVALGNEFNCVEFQNAGANTVGGAVSGAGNVCAASVQFNGVHMSNSTSISVLGNFIGTDVSGTVDLGNTLVGVQAVNSTNITIGGTSTGARNIISGNNLDGIFIGAGSSGNQILGNFIGTDVTGTVDLGNIWHGVDFYDTSNNTIGGTSDGARNIISGNNHDGVFIGGGSSGNEILGNFIGTDVSGTVDLGNNWNGVEFNDASNNTVGGTTAGARNVISGNEFNGVHMFISTSISVLGNFIGTDVSGTVALGNALVGVRVVSSTGVTIGGTSTGARNIISGNEQDGVRIVAQGNQVLGNFIGTDVSGTVALGNLLAGVEIEGGSNNTIGGTSDGAGNVISGNGDLEGWGVVLRSTSANEIIGNYIGTQVDGTSPLGNRLHGVMTADGASNNTIGGTGVTPGRCDGPCNRIGFTMTPEGLRILSGNGNAILGNSIFASAELGIDLGSSGVTPNDPGDGDTGANTLQNFPVLSLAEATPSGATVDGSLNSTPNLPFRVEFFANLACDSTGHGEGSRYLGFTDVLTDGTGNVSFSAALSASVSDGEAITTTATSMGLSSNTSEFSQCLTAICLSTAVFGQTVTAPDKHSLSWALQDDVRFVKGDLADVSGYSITETGELVDATSLDTSSDSPGAASGLYYLIRSMACGSWQTAPGAEAGRDALP